MKASCIVFLLIIFISSANAEDVEDDEEQDNQRISIYLHPGALYYAFMVGSIPTIVNAAPIYFYLLYLTVEIPLSLSNSLIIQPSLLYNEHNGNTYMANESNGNSIENMFRLGSGIGYRHFVNGKGDGLYLQVMSDFFYYSIKEEEESAYKKDFYADLLGYVGYSWKKSRLSIFSDIGIGVVSPSNDLSREVVTPGLWKNSITFDANFGIGLSF